MVKPHILKMAEGAISAAEHGDLKGLPQAFAELARDKSPGARALLLGLTAVRVSLDPTFLGVPNPSDADGLQNVPDAYHPIAVRACGRMIRIAALAFDGDAVIRWAQVQKGLGSGGKSQTWQLLADAWAALLKGEHDGASTRLNQALKEASGTHDAAATVELTVLRSLLEDDQGDLAAAVETARRAARMAQTEARPEEEYLAHLVLARLRRRAGRPHLAVHILTDLARHAPSVWHPFIAWELVIAGAKDKTETLLDAMPPALAKGPAFHLARAALDLLTGTKAGVRNKVSRAGSALLTAPPWTALRLEIEALLACIDISRAPAPGPVLGWSCGADGGVPYGLDGLGMLSSGSGSLDDTVGLVFAGPKQPGRRVLRRGGRLLPDNKNLETTNDEDTGGARTETGLAVLALAAPNPVARTDFFRAVYGFTFVHDRHRGVLDVLVHRMRARLGDAGTIEREAKDGTLSLALASCIVVPDGRCTLAPAERVLRALADLGTTGTQQTAERLNIPLRSVQRTLQELVADGSCESLRDGGNVVYRIRDTTFTSVTSLDALRLL